ncbi:helix-turn-helix transcriptional regulator [Mammaliicoccus sciuri]|uniref:helix-turn-helix domain-containing protein n=1 Tax=Sporosarcina sp. FSL K6-3508 TaxID=2921557 RepID=UPI003159AAC5
MKNGAILRACRERVGWSQAEMAEQLHVNQSDISKYENSTKEPNMSLLQRWAVLTNSQDILVAYLLGVEGITVLTSILSTVGTSIIGGFINFMY